jgi:HlyD family secretion protein
MTLTPAPHASKTWLRTLRDWTWPARDEDPSLDTAPIVRTLYVVIGVGLAGFLAWMAVTPLSGGVVSQGRVAVESNRKAIQHLEGGVVDKILVHNGQAVTAGQVLVRLRDVESRGAYGALDENYWGLRAAQTRLEHESRGAGVLTWPADVQAAAAHSQQIAQKLQNERAAFISRRQELSDKDAILNQRIAELAQQREGAAAQRQAAEDQLMNVRDELKDMSGLYERGLATRSRVLALQRSAQALEGEAGERGAEVSRLRLSEQETKLQIVQAHSERQSEVTASLEKTRSDLSETQGRRTASGDVLDRSAVRAPMSGVVMGLTIFTPGAVVKPGDTLMQVVPQGETLIVDTAIGLKDIATVHVGLPARVQFTAFPRTAPRLLGSVTYVSADALPDPQHNQSFYDARIAINAREMARLGDLKLVPGMPVEVFVETRKRTAMDYLFGPVFDLFSRAFRES